MLPHITAGWINYHFISDQYNLLLVITHNYRLIH